MKEQIEKVRKQSPKAAMPLLYLAIGILYADHVGVLEIDSFFLHAIDHPQDLAGPTTLILSVLAWSQRGGRRHDD